MADSLYIMPISKKFKGNPIEDIPSDFLRWCLDQEWFYADYPIGVNLIKKELDYRDKWVKHF